MSKLNVGDEVMMIEDEPHTKFPENYPAKGSIGVVVEYSPDDGTALVDWGKDSGVDLNDNNEYAWWCGKKRLAKVNANTQVNAQKGVYNMSKFKVGDKVVFLNVKKHKRMSHFYPTVGSIGIVDRVREECGDDETVRVDWGEAEGLETLNHKKTWWCNEKDIRLYKEYTDGEVWEMLKPKMRQIVPAHIANIDIYSPTVKNMVVAAYRSGYGRATKGRDFMIKPKVDEKPNEKSIDDVLGGKMIVTFYKDDDSYNVANFAYSRENGSKTEIYADIAYSSAGDSWSFGFDVLNDPDCEMYVAIPFSEAIGQFDEESIKAMYCGNQSKFSGRIKQYTIDKYIGARRFGNRDCVAVRFKPKYSDYSVFYPDIYSPDFKALVPIRDYLKHEGVNV